ncbi:unnamed protein product [Rotaria socialis]|uniref:Condensin complex subunit 1 C-terminal domain-containing protein n=1 Tax=Rotaria socialis TaxID=392032 RepID=A0A818EP85_9BILA|nr:unnamed protein product [Rotaria socialis]CAF4211022.1 unnamed protein product [Rotaria socialis]
MVITKEELNELFRECQSHKRNNPSHILSKLHAIIDDLIEHVERSHDVRKVFGGLVKEAIQDEIQSISSNQQTNGDDVYRQIIIFSLDLLCRYLLVLENLISDNDQRNGTQNNKKQKWSVQTCYTDWCTNERDEILYLFTNFIKLDLRQFWHETERLEDQQIGNTIVDACLTIIRNNQFSSRSRTVKDYLSFILALTIGLFRLEEESSMKIIQMLQIQEHTATIYSAVVVCHVKHFRTDTLLERIINDICHVCLSPAMIQSSLSNGSCRSNNSQSNTQNESNSSRTMAKLLDELSTHISDHLIVYINRLLDLFDSDCLQMRNCLLNICVNIIRYCSSLSEYKELRGELFLLIIDQYFLDSNVHVRSHAIGLCMNLVESKLIPTKFYCHLTQATFERMNDTSCIVRKHAIQLATKLLKFNPYTDRFLPIDQMLDEYNAEMNKLIRLQKLLGQTLKVESVPDDVNKTYEEEHENDLDNQHVLFERIVEQKQRVCAMYSADESLPSFEKYNVEMSKLMQLQSKLNNCLSTHSDIEIIDDEEPDEKATRLFDNMVKQSKLVSYLHNATDFCNHLRRFLAKDTFYLLSSKVTSDVLEIIDFLVLWSTFECESTAYKKLEQDMFSLIWSNDKNISNAVINAFKRICIKVDEDNTDEKISSKIIIEKLLDHIDLNLTLTFEHILKQLLSESASVTANILSFIDALLDYYLELTTNNSKKNSSDDFIKLIRQRQSSFLQLISLVIPYDKKHRLSSHFNCIIQNFLRKISSENLEYVRYQLQIISNILTAKSSYSIPNEFYDLIIKKLLDSDIKCDQRLWINCMKQFITILFLKEPNQLSANDLMMKFHQALADQIHWSFDYTDYQPKVHDISWRTIFIRMLASINALLSHRVQKIECINLSSIKKVQQENDSFITNDDDNETNNENSLLSSSSSSSSRQFVDENNQHNTDNQEDATSIQQQNSDLSQLENELLQSNTFFSSIEKWMETFIYEDHSLYDENLVSTSILTCTRMMYVSSVLCSKYVDRIFELSKICAYSSVRSALIVSLGDLLLRHPNIIEPFTPQFYAQIHDIDLSVGETALCTIAILILREMIKVRGYISEIALCLFHSHTPISSIAQHFFDELSLRQRGLALFNVLPDIISRLSMNNICSTDSFQQIISYLFSFIKNDRHCEILVKRLCRQFKQACGDDRKRANIAFCLSKLNIKTLASYRILKENFPNTVETNENNEDDYDQEEHLAWKKYLMPVLNDIERRLKPAELNSSKPCLSSSTPKRKVDRLS